jgi:hypothetical protein
LSSDQRTFDSGFAVAHFKVDYLHFIIHYIHSTVRLPEQASWAPFSQKCGLLATVSLCIRQWP